MKNTYVIFYFFSFVLLLLNSVKTQKELPVVRWGQSSSTINLFILIPSIKEETVKFSNEDIQVSASDSNGKQFELKLNTLRDIIPERSTYMTILNTGIRLKVQKKTKEPCWKYLTKERTNQYFIRDKALGDGNDCEEAKELWFSEYKHHIRLLKYYDDPSEKKPTGIEGIIRSLEKTHHSFSVQEI